jgi:hypothetical protein
MAAPTQPTKTTICTEALKRFLNGGTPEATDITRAEDYGLEKVKRDIMNLGKTWRPLLRTAYSVTKSGVSDYSNPSDYADIYTVSIMSGDHVDALSYVTSKSSVTLANTEDATKVEVEGKMLLITSGAGANQAVQVDEYTTATKICAMAAEYDTLPVATNGYMVCNSIASLYRMDVDRYDLFQYPGVAGVPARYTIIANNSAGYVALHPVPNGVYGIRTRYYADLLNLDMALALYNTILRRWAGVFEQGVYVWKLSEDDDRYEAQNALYQRMLMNIVAYDLDGYDPNDTVKQ